MKNNLLSFLFLESAKPSAIDIEDRALEQLLEAVGDVETGDLESKKTPLAKALGEFGITDSDLQLDPEGFCLVTDNHERYVDIVNVLGTADAMHKLAEMGWVVSKLGDAAMTSEPAEYRVRFMEITTVDSGEDKEKGEATKTIIKNAREFATTPLDRDDDLNPVEDEDGKMGKRNTGVGDAKDGKDPEGKPKGSSKQEGQEKSKPICRSCHKPLHYDGQTECQHCGKIQYQNRSGEASHAARFSTRPRKVQEMTSTGSMGTVEGGPQGIVAPGIIKKPKPYGKGTKFAMPGQWKVKQPIVNAQVKRHPQSEALGSSGAPSGTGAEEFLGEPVPTSPQSGALSIPAERNLGLMCDQIAQKHHGIPYNSLSDFEKLEVFNEAKRLTGGDTASMELETPDPMSLERPPTKPYIVP